MNASSNVKRFAVDVMSSNHWVVVRHLNTETQISKYSIKQSISCTIPSAESCHTAGDRYDRSARNQLSINPIIGNTCRDTESLGYVRW